MRGSPLVVVPVVGAVPVPWVSSFSPLLVPVAAAFPAADAPVFCSSLMLVWILFRCSNLPGLVVGLLLDNR